MRTMVILGLVLFSFSGYSQTGADIFGTKAYLESLMVERFTRELSTRLDKDKFKISANIQVARVKRKPAQESPLDDTYTDLELGFLDPDKLLDQANEPQVTSFLQNFDVRGITVMAGINEALGEDIRKETETWLQKRVKDEFGSRGESAVQFIKVPDKEKVAEKIQSPIEMLRDFQDLAGQVLLALTILFGLVLWKILSGKGNKAGSGASVNVNNKLESGDGAALAAAGGGPGGNGHGSVENETKIKESVKQQTDAMVAQIVEIAPKMTKEIPGIVEEWCRQGDEGQRKVAVLAQIVGQTIGPVPIPNEFHEPVTNMFTKMADMNPNTRLNVSTQVYWDLMAVMNLGRDYLREPFSFFKGAPSYQVGSVLMEKNPEMQAVASVFLPRDHRESFFNGLDDQKKIEMLEVASQLEKMQQDEVDQLETELAPMFETQDEVKMVNLSQAFEGFVDVMSKREAITILKDIKGPAVEHYKRNFPSMAFLHEWSDQDLGQLVTQVGQQELMALLVLRQDLYDRIVNIVPPRLKQIITDDFKTAQNMGDMEIEQLLEKLHMNLVLFVDRGNVDLQTVFQNAPEATDDTISAA